MKGPLTRAPGSILDFFGISKIAQNFPGGVSDEYVLTVNAQPYLLDSLQSDGANNNIGAVGFNGLYTNTSTDTLFLRAASVLSPGALTAGQSITGCMAILSFNNSPFPMVTKLSEFTSATVGGLFLAGDQFFASPIPLAPQDVLGVWATALAAGPIPGSARIIFQ